MRAQYQIRVCPTVEWAAWAAERSEDDIRNAGIVVVGEHPRLGVVIDCAAVGTMPGRLYHAAPGRNRYNDLPSHVLDAIVPHWWAGEE